jgi:hypothetical protein
MTAMTRAECARLGALSDQQLADMGEPPGSIAFIRERAEQESPTPLYVGVDLGADDRTVIAAVERIENGEPLFNVIADLCRPMEKL